MVFTVNSSHGMLSWFNKNIRLYFNPKNDSLWYFLPYIMNNEVSKFQSRNKNFLRRRPAFKYRGSIITGSVEITKVCVDRYGYLWIKIPPQ